MGTTLFLEIEGDVLAERFGTKEVRASATGAHATALFGLGFSTGAFDGLERAFFRFTGII